MQYLKTIFIIITLCLAAIWANAQQNASSTPSILVKKDKNVSSRPKAPSIQIITCIYEYGALKMNFRASEGICTVIILNNENCTYLNETFDSSELYYETHVDIEGECEIILTTEYGNTYIGTINLE